MPPQYGSSKPKNSTANSSNTHSSQTQSAKTNSKKQSHSPQKNKNIKEPSPGIEEKKGTQFPLKNEGSSEKEQNGAGLETQSEKLLAEEKARKEQFMNGKYSKEKDEALSTDCQLNQKKPQNQFDCFMNGNQNYDSNAYNGNGSASISSWGGSSPAVVNSGHTSQHFGVSPSGYQNSKQGQWGQGASSDPFRKGQSNYKGSNYHQESNSVNSNNKGYGSGYSNYNNQGSGSGYSNYNNLGSGYSNYNNQGHGSGYSNYNNQGHGSGYSNYNNQGYGSGYSNYNNQGYGSGYSNYSQKQNEGLPNIGNTCFLNSVLQLLYSAKSFRDKVLAFDGSSYIHKQKKKNSQQMEIQQPHLLFELRQIFSSIKKKDTNEKKRKNLDALTLFLQRNHPYYRSRSQQDAFDFLMLIISSTIAGDIDLRDFFKIEYSATCRCKKKQDIFRQYQLNKEDPICMACKEQSTIRLYESPNYLIIIGDNTGSIDYQMTYETEKKREIVVYSLISAIVYSGSGQSGHYTSLRKSETKDTWLKINDSQVEEIKESEVKQKRINLMLYEKKEKMSGQKAAKTIKQDKLKKEDEKKQEKKKERERKPKVESVIDENMQLVDNVIYKTEIDCVKKLMFSQKDAVLKPVFQKNTLYFIVTEKSSCWAGLNYQIRILNAENFFGKSNLNFDRKPKNIGEVINFIEKEKQQGSRKRFEKIKGQFYKQLEQKRKHVFSYYELSEQDEERERFAVNRRSSLANQYKAT